MERETKRQKKIKQQDRKMRKIHKKYSLIVQIQLWLERHPKLAFLMDGGIILFSIFGIMYVLFGTSLIPKPYQNLNYVFPLYMNLVFLVNMLYQIVFRDNFDGMLTAQDFADPFLYLNGVGLLFHSFFGIMGRNRKTIPPLLTLDHRYIWFPILTYITFFLVATLIILIS